MIYGYLRVSSDKQDVSSQQIGVERKAKELDVSINEWIKDEGISGTVEYKKRNLGGLIDKAKPGDIIIVSEISRLARSVFMLFRIVEYCVNNEIIIYSVKDNTTIKKGDLIATMAVFFFGIAAQIEREMIVKRTVEGLERRRRDGVIFGRPIGSESAKKLNGKEDLVVEYIEAGLGVSQIARLLKVNRETLRRLMESKGIQTPESKYYNNLINKGNKFNRWKQKGIENDKLFSQERSYIISLIDEGFTDKYIIEKLRDKGVVISNGAFIRLMHKDKELYEYFKAKYNSIRKEKNKDCGSNKHYYKF